jgi:Trypsin
MRSITTGGACGALAAALVAATVAAPASASAPDSGSEQAGMRLQHKVAEARLANKVAVALGDEYAGVWFDPAGATLHVGVTSSGSRRAVERVAGGAGLSADVATTAVHSSWRSLLAAQRWWNGTLATLLANSQASTGVDPARNEVGITLSSSVPDPVRAGIVSVAASADVRTSVSIVPPSQLRIEQRALCKAPFEALNAYCEKTLVAGVGIAPGTAKPICTAGPMLIKGYETYMLTSGHCFGEEEANGALLNVATTSAYKNLEQKEIGKEVTQYYSTARDMAEVRIKRPGSAFVQALPTPLPALVAEWKAKPEVPRTVPNFSEVIGGQKVCHEGMVSGEACGEVKKLNVTFATKEHLVEVNACGSKGDSGGPYFVRGKGEEPLELGIETAGPKPECAEPGPYLSYFEPLEGLAGAAEFGILQTFAGQKVLTTANENRGKGPYYRIKGVLGGKSEVEGKANKEFIIKTLVSKVKCLQAKLEKSSITDATGEGVVKYENCTVEGNGTGCEVEGKTFKSEALQTALAFSNKASVKGETLLIALKPKVGNAFAKVKFTGEKCTVKETTTEGTLVGEDWSGGKAVKLEEEPAESETNETSFPEATIKTAWVESEGTRSEVKGGLTIFGLAATVTGRSEAKLVGGGLWGVFTK